MTLKRHNVYILEDIDQVLYPIKTQIIKYLDSQNRNNNKLFKKIIKEFKNSESGYFGTFLKRKFEIPGKENNEGKTIYLNTIGKTLKLEEKEFYDINSLHFKLLRDLGNSKYFLYGINPEMQQLNKELDEYGIIRIGITARGNTQKPDYLYDDCINKTNQWNVNEQAGLNHIFLQNFGDKHKTLEQIKQLYPGFCREHIVCMIEDNPKGLDSILEKGIKGILISLEPKRYKDKISYLKKKYGNQLYIFNNHEGARLKAIELAEDKLYELRKS